MGASLQITVLIEDRSSRDDLSAEHGLSLWVKIDGFRLLFDTGRSGAFLSNARVLGVPVENADALVLSHGHYDHTGGLAALPAEVGLHRLYLHPAAVVPRYSSAKSLLPRQIGMPPQSVAAIERMNERVVWTLAPTRISERIGVTGPIPRNTDFEDVGGPFYLDPGCSKPDAIPDDQAVWVDTEKGIAVLLGCAHAGVANTLDYVAELTRVASIHAIIGGMHLGDASKARLRATADGLRRYNVQLVAPCHCSGSRAVEFLAREFPEKVRNCAAGARFSF
jgi:7,8-dihydropterin-6-yl-methyl-4-(beta-D-ribofuranosyl)aminobenzene 5'-phosphate synthase